MFLSHWFELSGIDRVLAPLDPDQDPVDDGEDNNRVGNGADEGYAESPFWSIVAPRAEETPTQPKEEQAHESKKRQEETMGNVPSAAAAPPVAKSGRDEGKMVRCQHCHQMTPVDGPSAAAATGGVGGADGSASGSSQQLNPSTPASSTLPATPANTPAITNEHNEGSVDDSTNFHTHDILDEQAYLRRQVLDAAQRTAALASAPTFEWENAHNLFSLCGAPPKPPKKGKDGKPVPPKLGEDGRPVPTKNVKKLVKMLGNKPRLVMSRSANMTSLGLPDGYTVLHAACHAGNAEVVAYLLDNWVRLGDEPSGEAEGGEEEGGEGQPPRLDLNARDVQGRTPLHVAAAQGHVDVVSILEKAYHELDDEWDRMMAGDIVEDVEHGSSDDEQRGGVEKLGEEMAQLSTAESHAAPPPKASTGRAVAPKTPGSKSPMRFRRRTSKTPRSRSPKPPNSGRSPMRSPLRSPVRSPPPGFAGPTAPVDLSGRTPLGCAATSPVPKARQHRAALERAMYREGDRSILGAGHTPPRERCGPRGRYASPVGPNGAVGGGGAPLRSGGGGTNAYLSPTPGKRRGRYSTPGSAASSQYATPFHTPGTIPEEGEPAMGNEAGTNPLRLQWGASEMNGWRIEMEDKILVKYPLYGDGEGLPPRPAANNDDAVAAASHAPPTVGLFGVFDGHGDGGHASDFVATHLEQTLKAQPEWSLAYYGGNDAPAPLLQSVFAQACYDLDRELTNDKSRPRDGGTTMIAAMVTDRCLYVANVGDSRCILVRRKQPGEKEGTACWDPSDLEVVPMSEDHKPDLPEERSRIESAGLSVQTDHVPPSEEEEHGEFTTVHRVKRSDKELLGVSRAFGDHDYKSNEALSVERQAVVCTPAFEVWEREDGMDMYLVLACDGIWDVMTNEDAGAFVARRVAESLGWADASSTTSGQSQEKVATRDLPDNTVQGEVLARVGDELLAECLKLGSRDNMSVLIVALPASGLSGVAMSSSAKGDAPADGTVRALAYE